MGPVLPRSASPQADLLLNDVESALFFVARERIDKGVGTPTGEQAVLALDLEREGCVSFAGQRVEAPPGDDRPSGALAQFAEQNPPTRHRCR